MDLKLFEGDGKAYTHGGLLGEGGNGKVFSARRNSDGLPVAIKHVRKTAGLPWRKLGGLDVPREVSYLHRGQGVPGVIGLLDYWDCQDCCHMVMELPHPVENLLDFITSEGGVTERRARSLFRQLVVTVLGLSQRGVVHRDIKTMNVLVDIKRGQLKLVDFGSAVELVEGDYTSFSGTPLNSPPEWLRHGRYRALPATVWTLGLLLYELLTDRSAFKTTRQITLGKVAFPRWMSAPAQDLIRQCLSLAENERPSLQVILDHRWLMPQRA